MARQKAKASKSKSKGTKKKAPKKSIFEQITRPGLPSRKAVSKGGRVSKARGGKAKR